MGGDEVALHQIAGLNEALTLAVSLERVDTTAAPRRAAPRFDPRDKREIPVASLISDLPS
jgi:hypothetical protein